MNLGIKSIMNNEKKVICFYHRIDFDGKCSGAIVLKKYPKCEMIGIDYPDKFPWEKIEQGSKVIMVDFSLKSMDDMIKLDRLCVDKNTRESNFIWIDHHKSAIDEADKKDFKPHGLRKVGTAGCELTWEYFFKKEDMPKAVYLLGRYDVWDESVKDAFIFQYGMKIFSDTKPDSDIWVKVFDDNSIPSITEKGAIAEQYQISTNIDTCERTCFEIEFDGLKCLASNNTFSNSITFKSMWDNKKYDAMLSFYMIKDKVWKVSLYTDKPGVDVSVVCKRHGGGGHEQAAGFSVEDINEIFKKKD